MDSPHSANTVWKARTRLCKYLSWRRYRSRGCTCHMHSLVPRRLLLSEQRGGGEVRLLAMRRTWKLVVESLQIRDESLNRPVGKCTKYHHWQVYIMSSRRLLTHSYVEGIVVSNSSIVPILIYSSHEIVSWNNYILNRLLYTSLSRNIEIVNICMLLANLGRRWHQIPALSDSNRLVTTAQLVVSRKSRAL